MNGAKATKTKLIFKAGGMMRACNSVFITACEPTGGGALIRYPKVKQKPDKTGSLSRELNKLDLCINNNNKKAEIAPTR